MPPIRFWGFPYSPAGGGGVGPPCGCVGVGVTPLGQAPDCFFHPRSRCNVRWMKSEGGMTRRRWAPHWERRLAAVHGETDCYSAPKRLTCSLGGGVPFSFQNADNHSSGRPKLWQVLNTRVGVTHGTGGQLGFNVLLCDGCLSCVPCRGEGRARRLTRRSVPAAPCSGWAT